MSGWDPEERGISPDEADSSARNPFDVPLTLTIRREDDPNSQKVQTWTGRFLVVGRRTDCGLCLDDPTVSARHLYLQRLPGRVVVFDLGSRDFRHRQGVLGRSGFRLADQLPPGEEVQVGRFWLSLTHDKSSEAFPGLEPFRLPELAKPVAVWEMMEPARERIRRRRMIQHEVTLIGRGPQCRWRLSQETVSTTHASLVFLQGELQVIDLCSRYGVRVNGRLVQSARLADGDHLAVGDCQGIIRWLKTSRPERAEPNTAVRPVVETPSNPFPDSGADLECRLSDPDEVHAGGEAESYREFESDFDLPTLLAESVSQQEQVREDARQVMVAVQSRLKPSPRELVRPVHSEEDASLGLDGDVFEAESSDGRPNSELHAWLNERLAGLEGESSSLWSRFWDCVTGLPRGGIAREKRRRSRRFPSGQLD